MIASQIGIVLCRVGAVVLVVEAIRSLGYIVPGVLQFDRDLDADVALILLMFATPSFAAAALWIFAARISKAPGGMLESTQTERIGQLDLISIGTLLIGLYVFVFGIVSGMMVEVTSWIQPELGADYQDTVDRGVAIIVGRRASYLVQIVLGLVLIFGRSRIAQLLSRLRYAGTGAS